MPESQDKQEFRNVLEVAAKYFKKNRNTLKMAEKLLNAMVDKSLEFIESDIDIPDIRFTHEELYRLVWTKNSLPDKASSTIRSYRKQLHELLEESSSLSLFLVESGCKYLLEFDFDDVKGHDKTTQGLVLKSSKFVKSHTVSNTAKYKVVKIPKPNWWMNRLMKVELEGKNVYWFFSVILLCLLSLALIPFIIFKGLVSGIAAGLVIGIILAASGGLFYQIYELMEKGVSKAPNIFTPFRIKNLFFVTTRKPISNSDALRPKVIELLAFEGHCGLCGDELFIEKSREFKGRYVGKCAVAPQEHIFSFDHVNKVGKHLR